MELPVASIVYAIIGCFVLLLTPVFAWMIYLNDIEKGGGTEFPYQKVKTKAIAGDFYIWPTSWSHFHKGIKAPKECKYLLTGWASYLPLY